MIVKVEFEPKLNFPNDVMLFGGSYKDWKQQFEEFARAYGFGYSDIASLEKSRSKWIGFGGLKWCHESKFQEMLNREGCQKDDPDNPNPRQYETMRFTASPNDLHYAQSYLIKVKAGAFVAAS